VSTNPTYEIHGCSLILPLPLHSCKQNGTNRSLTSCFSERMSQVASTGQKWHFLTDTLALVDR
ncbi:MAG TPA: hypothetical protein VE843_06260, partial [Ktedonobacteraceae bacterium]|nr:hypothetical protein [Ktedonobacteraceae bacterium]